MRLKQKKRVKLYFENNAYQRFTFLLPVIKGLDDTT
jgi:hypothetical protein